MKCNQIYRYTKAEWYNLRYQVSFAHCDQFERNIDQYRGTAKSCLI